MLVCKYLSIDPSLDDAARDGIAALCAFRRSARVTLDKHLHVGSRSGVQFAQLDGLGICRERKPTRTGGADLKNLIAVPVLTGALIAALITPAGIAPAFCDAADCVPGVTRNVTEGMPCVPQPLYDFGLDSDHRTFVCATTGAWLPAGSLVGLREVAAAVRREQRLGAGFQRDPVDLRTDKWPRAVGEPHRYTGTAAVHKRGARKPFRAGLNLLVGKTTAPSPRSAPPTHSSSSSADNDQLRQSAVAHQLLLLLNAPCWRSATDAAGERRSPS
jgi:hypothetical protein